MHGHEKRIFLAWDGFAQRAAESCNIVGTPTAILPPWNSHVLPDVSPDSPIQFVVMKRRLFTALDPDAFVGLPDSAIYTLFLKGFAAEAAKLSLGPATSQGEVIFSESLRLAGRIQYGMGINGVEYGTFPWLD